MDHRDELGSSQHLDDHPLSVLPTALTKSGLRLKGDHHDKEKNGSSPEREKREEKHSDQKSKKENDTPPKNRVDSLNSSGSRNKTLKLRAALDEQAKKSPRNEEDEQHPRKRSELREKHKDDKDLHKLGESKEYHRDRDSKLGESKEHHRDKDSKIGESKEHHRDKDSKYSENHRESSHHRDRDTKPEREHSLHHKDARLHESKEHHRDRDSKLGESKEHHRDKDSKIGESKEHHRDKDSKGSEHRDNSHQNHREKDSQSPTVKRAEKEEKERDKDREKERDKKEKPDKEKQRRIEPDPQEVACVEEVHKSLKKTGLNDFERLRLLGRGGIGHVYLVRLKGTDQLYAMKVLRKKDMIATKRVKRILTEREVLATADHPFIVTLYYSFQSQTQLCFIMQYCAGGEFYRWILAQPSSCLTEEQARFYAVEVLLALEYLHSKGFIYRDLKPENILMHASGHIMLADFDLSKHALVPVTPRVVTKPYSGDSGVVQEPDLITNSFVGTEEYLAPEVIKGKGHGPAVDWWTFGILIFEMLFGTTPFRGRSRNDTFSNIEKRKLYIPEHRRHALSKNCKKLLKALLDANPQKRLGGAGGATDIKDHPFFKDVKWQLVRHQTPPIVPHLTSSTDLQYFQKIEDDWVWDASEIDPSELADNDPFRPFQVIDRTSKDLDRDGKDHS